MVMSLRSIFSAISLVTVLLLLVATTAQAAPVTPSDLQVQVGRDYVDLWWLSSEGATNYLVYRSNQAGEMEVVANITAPITAYHDSDLDDGSNFIYYVTAVNGDGESAPSSSVSATVPVKESVDSLLPVIALVLSAIAIQVCVVMLLYFFKMNMKLK
jgi:hypothetical protein